MMTDEEMAALPACPFCGGHALENLDTALYGGPVMCIDCGARGPTRFAVLALKAPDLANGISDGIEAWSVRAGEKERAFMAAAMGEGL